MSLYDPSISKVSSSAVIKLLAVNFRIVESLANGRKSVVNVKGGGLHGAPAVYDEARVKKRSSIICKAIAARQQKFPNEKPYLYKPFEGETEMFKWDENAKADMHDYNLLDFSI